MIRLISFLVEAGAIAWVIQGLLSRLGKRAPEGARIPFEKALSFYERYGRNSNSFMTLYPGFRYFESKDPAVVGLIAYVDTTHAWVAAAEPLAAEEHQIRLLEEFARAALEAGKRVLLIPADQDFAERAEKAGFDAIVVGSEPTFLLDQYPKSGKSWLDLIPAARQLSSKGAAVREFKAAELTEELRAELDRMTQDWLRTRKTATLGFLNQVDPWLHSEHKKYFAVELGGKVLAFLAAIPIRTRNGWYLIDTIRREDSPPGATELLLLQAMSMLREQGVREITFGVAPLSGIEAAGEIQVARPERHRMLYGILHAIFERGNQFYNFKPLFAYKMKFQPTVVRPVFLLYRGRRPGGRLSMSDVVSLSQAWLPHGIAHAAGLGMIRLISRLILPDLIKSLLRPGTVVRSVPPSWLRLIHRCRLTVGLIAVSVAIYFASTDSRGLLLPEIRERWAFAWDRLARDPPHALFLFPFLQADVFHFVLSLLCLVVFTGGLEYLAGTSIAAFCFFVPCFLSTPLVALVVAAGLGRIFPWIDGNALFVGGSLGVLGTAGGLYWFIRNGAMWLTALAAAAGWALFSSSHPATAWIQLNHWVAILLGVAVAKVLLRA